MNLFSLALGRGRLVIAALACLVLVAAPAAATDQEHHATVAQLESLAKAFRHVAKTATPGVVHISVRGNALEGDDVAELHERFRERMPNVPEERLRELFERNTSGYGSGVVFDASGHILTNNHVVEGRATIVVRLPDDREFPAELVGADPKTDIAVVKIKAEGLHPLKLGDSDEVQVGDWVIAVGAPFGLDHTVTHGIISATGRTQVRGVSILYQDFLQTDAAINPGNSGGPLLNLHGEVIGINTAIATHGDAVNAGIAFTIPSNMARKIAQRLIESGEVTRGWLGISMSELSPSDVEIFSVRKPEGVFVERVLTGTPAADAGLQVEDVIVRVNGTPIADIAAVRHLIADLPPGRVITLDVVRDSEIERVRVTLGEQPEDVGRFGRGASSRRSDALDAFVRTMRPSLAEAYGYERTARGVLVVRVDGDSVSAALTEGDLVVACNGKPVQTVGDLNVLLGEIDAGKTIELGLESQDGEERIVYLNR